MKKLEDHSILAWVGEDEGGSGVIGIKQAAYPPGSSRWLRWITTLHKLVQARS